MIFKDLLDSKLGKLNPVFSKMLQLACENQVHEGDLLLIHLNGFYYPEVYSWNNLPEKRSPYMIGPSYEGHAAFTHEEYITNYFESNISKKSQSEYKNYLENLKNNDNKQFQKINKANTITLQNEMLIYLKIWESDFFIKKLYQLVNLIKGEPFDWHFKITPNNNEKNGTGSRSTIIREKVRDKLKDELPELYNSLLNSYNTQIRNAIAHSQYYMNGNIMLNNFKKNGRYNSMRKLTRDEWTDRFHESLAIYMHTNMLMSVVNNLYGEYAMQNQGRVEVKINRTDPKEEVENKFVFYRPSYKDWSWSEGD